ncbi:hypothetical protein VTH06DRAFT_6289 [Thermothelomyces fergusii]
MGNAAVCDPLVRMGSAGSEDGLEKPQRIPIDRLRIFLSVQNPVVVFTHVGSTDGWIHGPNFPPVVFEDLRRCLLVGRISEEGYPIQADRQDDEEGHGGIPSVGLVVTRRPALGPESVTPEVCARLRPSVRAGDPNHDSIRPQDRHLPSRLATMSSCV